MNCVFSVVIMIKGIFTVVLLAKYIRKFCFDSLSSDKYEDEKKWKFVEGNTWRGQYGGSKNEKEYIGKYLNRGKIVRGKSAEENHIMNGIGRKKVATNSS